MLPFDPIATSWTAFHVGLVLEVVILGVPCAAVSPRGTRDWMGHVVDHREKGRLDWSDWIGIAGIGLTFPGLGLLALARLLRNAPPRTWGRRQLMLAWLCAGVGSFGFLFFALFYAVPFSGPLRLLGLANLAAGAVGMPLLAVALTIAWSAGGRPERGRRAV